MVGASIGIPLVIMLGVLLILVAFLLLRRRR